MTRRSCDGNVIFGGTPTRQEVVEELRVAAAEGRSGLDEHSSKWVIGAFGIKTPRRVLVQSANFHPAELDGLSEPFAVKMMSPDVVHKSDLGAVRLRVARADVATVCHDMVSSSVLSSATCDGFIVEEMGEEATELVIGGMVDPTFGPVIMVGLGGVLVELQKDVSFRLCPVERVDAREMIDELRGRAIFDGYRGQPAIDVDAVLDAIVAIGGAEGLMLAGPAGMEIDINPLLAGPSELLAVDAQIIFTEPIDD